MKSTALMLMVVTVLSKILGFIREMVIASFYGTSATKEAFVIAQTIPFFIFGFITTGITTEFIPFYNNIEKKHGEKRADLFTANIGNITLFLTLILTVLGIIFAKSLVKVFAFGFTGEKLQMAVLFTRICLLSISASAVASIYRGYLNIKGNFIVHATQGFIMNIIIIISIILSKNINVLILPIGLCIGVVFQHIFYIPALKKVGYVHKWFMNFKDENIKNMLILALPVILGVAVNQVNVLIDKSLSSAVSENGVAILDYANRLNDFVVGIVVVSVGTAVYPILSKSVAEGDIKNLKNNIMESISHISFLIIPAMLGLMIFAKPIVIMLFERREFTRKDSIDVAAGLFYYASGIIWIAIRDILSKGFYAMQDTGTPVKNSIIMVVINIISSIILSRFMGLSGLALGTSFSAMIGAFLIMGKLKNKIGPFVSLKSLKNTFKIIISSIYMGIVSGYAYNTFSKSMSISKSLLVSIFIAMIVYFISINILKVEEIVYYKKALKKKLNKKK